MSDDLRLDVPLNIRLNIRLNLEQQRKRAKDLLRAFRRGDADAVDRVHRHLPRAAGLLAAQVRALPLQLADAQLVVAREAGFPTWPRLKDHVEQAPAGDRVPAIQAAVAAGDVDAVRAALAARPPLWETREALEHAVERDDRESARLLLAYGAPADRAGRRWGRWGGCLHSALLLGRDLEMVEVLLDAGASVEARDTDGRTPLEIAVRTANTAAAELLRRRGATERGVSEVDRLLGACIAGETPTRPPGSRLRRSDHQHVCWAVRSGHHEAVPALLAFGLDPDVPDDDGETALHLAVAARSPAALQAVLAGRPRVDARNFRDETPLTCALRERDDRPREAMVGILRRAGARPDGPTDLAVLFEEAADAVVAGDLERLRTLLDREPLLATAHSVREHRATLLHYVGANGVEWERQRSPPNAAGVVDLLIARGADPDALAFTYGGGKGQTTLGLAVTSVHPDEAGVMGDIVHALVRGGARVNGLDDDDLPLRGSRRGAWPALLACGANVDLISVAALGRQDLVERLLAPDGTLLPGATLGPDLSRPAQEVLDEAFLEACEAKSPPTVAYLLRAGARLEARDGQGFTGLHLAAWGCDLETVRLLRDRGASLEARNDYGGTVLGGILWCVRNEPARGRDFAALVEMLIAAGADLGAVHGGPTGHAAVDAVLRRRSLPPGAGPGGRGGASGS